MDPKETNLEYHSPVLLDDCIEGLAIKPEGVYVDVTFGGGGHSRAILSKLGPKGQLFGFDQDVDAHENIIEDERFKLIPFNFRHLKRFLRLEGVRKVDGILADLGVSSHQFDSPERGFSFRFDVELDMRMGQTGELTAQKVINSYRVSQLQDIFSRYGELRNAKTTAEAIVKAREVKKIERVGQLVQVLGPCIRGKRNRYLSQLFQALRIEVNSEMEVLKELLLQSIEVLKPKGRLVVLSYHSLEDRLVKNLIKKGTFEKEPEKDLYGNFYLPLKAINRKVIAPSAEEITKNPRARSAKLRIAERQEDQK